MPGARSCNIGNNDADGFNVDNPGAASPRQSGNEVSWPARTKLGRAHGRMLSACVSLLTLQTQSFPRRLSASPLKAARRILRFASSGLNAT